MKPDDVRAHWEAQAARHAGAPEASWSDVRVMELEVRELSRRLSPAASVLDVGCANGWSTLRLAAAGDATFRGIDYVPAMIDAARARLAEQEPELRGRVRFDVGDALALEDPDETYDAVLSTRVLINLGSWEAQLRGLDEYLRVLRRGGVLLLSEATVQGAERLNALRAEWGLPPIPAPDFNTYLDEDRVIEALAERCELSELVNFASTYYVGTRVLKPLLARASGAPVDVADPRSEWNRFFASLPAGGDYGTQKLFVFEKL